VINDRNIAIGKARTLGSTLRWLYPHAVSAMWLQMVRDRFAKRMGPYLPRREIWSKRLKALKPNPLWYQILLPGHLGGLNLWLSSDFPGMIQYLPGPTMQILNDLKNNSWDRADLRKLSKFTTNPSIRGYSLEDSIADFLVNSIENAFLDKEDSWKITKESKITYDNIRDRTTKLQELGWYTLQDTVELGLRAILFRDIMLGKAAASPYNTMPWRMRYQIIWDCINRGVGIPNITIDDLPIIFKKGVDSCVYNIGKKSPGFSYYSKSENREVVVESISPKDELLLSLPSLTIPRNWIGELSSEGIGL